MTKRELNSRQSNKYGSLTEINRSQFPGIETIKDIHNDLCFKYVINKQYVKLFGDILIYMTSPDVNQAEETISNLLREHKLF